MLTLDHLKVARIEGRRVRSPLKLSTARGDGLGDFVADEARVRFQVVLLPGEEARDDLLFEKAGPREFLCFPPRETRAAIVTCGGLCPGMNNVIRSLFYALSHNYGIGEILGIRYGFRGFNTSHGIPPVRMTPAYVENIHKHGGTALGSSRGPEDPRVIVDFLEKGKIQLLFCIGGDGTQRGAHTIYEESRRRGFPLSVVGIPKTIDNDILYVWQTFGFSTALEKARDFIGSAHEEARGAPNGVSIVKVMGRDAGFIAAGATLASQEVNFTLIPEVSFELDGPGGFLEVLKQRVLDRKHAVIVVAEGAGRNLLGGPVGCDASGNPKYPDVGIFLRNAIAAFFERSGIPLNLRYFDPSYLIRSAPANIDDSLLCDQLARNAAHAALAGKTDVLIGYWHNTYIHVPIPTAIAGKKQVGPESELWASVLAATGQPSRFGEAPG
ncbi:MAG: ATP-dependent 6-phosphofructokinase [Deltaproteobacteria bacterium]|nr:ATP-dependent 6-phosphofructokinase [Deltaproteobacteria bacterium]